MKTYEADYAGWLEGTAEALRQGRFEEIDRVALAEELQSLSTSAKTSYEVHYT